MRFKPLSLTLAGIALAGALSIYPQSPATADPWPAGSGTEIGGGLSSNHEGSGVVWHERLQVLFLVCDEGWVTQMDSDGSNVTTWTFSGDYEAITIADSTSDYLYIGVEHPDSIVEFDITPGSLTGKSWDLTSWMAGPSNKGLEALTFVPNGHHPYSDSDSGGLFYAGLQNDGKIYVFDVDLSASGTVSYVDTITPSPLLVDIAGLHYLPETETLYAAFDASNCLREMKADGTIIVSYDLPGDYQEGIAVVPSCLSSTAYFYVTYDQGPREVYRYDSYPVSLVDYDCDGLTDAEESSYGTDTTSSDTDSDGLSDYGEVYYDGDSCYNPYDPASGTGTDTDATNADTDGDGFGDYVEIQCGGDPINSSYYPQTMMKLAIMKKEGVNDTNLYYYNSPVEDDWTYWDAASRNPSPLARDLWIIPSDNDTLTMTEVDADGAGAQKLALLKAHVGSDQNLYLYNVPLPSDRSYWDADARNPSPLARDLWVVPAGNDTALTADGGMRIASMKNEDGDHNLYLYNTPAQGDWTYWDAKARNPSPWARDLWVIPHGNDAVAMCGLDTTGDDLSDSLLVVRNEGGSHGLYLWNMPAQGDWTYWDAKARNPSPRAMDLWVIPQRNDIADVAGINRGSTDELAVMENYDGDYNLYIWNAPVPGDVTEAQALARNPSPLARDLWVIPSGNNTIEMAAPN